MQLHSFPRFILIFALLGGTVPQWLQGAPIQEAIQKSEPVAYWSFEEAVEAALIEGKAVRTGEDAAVAPEFPDFGQENSALRLNAPGWLRIQDTGEKSQFDFDNGDAITVEAWVKPTEMVGNAYILSKGRTGNPGMASHNQNWAFRLIEKNGQLCPNLLFRSRPDGDWAGDWHRWTSNEGVLPDAQWHHVAITYKFGDPESVRAYVDGKELTKGTWDYAGATQRAPVVDDDEVWLGAGMGGSAGSAFRGMLDEVALYRRQLSSEELKSRFHYKPQPFAAPQVPKDKVLVQLFGPISSLSSIPRGGVDQLAEWEQSTFGFTRLPQKYDDWAIREDWPKTLLVRAWSEVELEPGRYQFMLRTRGMARLWIDDEIYETTPAQRNRGGAHHEVDPLPEVPVEGMRPHGMNDHERIVEFTSKGGTHKILYEIIVGGPKYRTEFGETSLSIAEPLGMYEIVSHGDTFELTDEGWLSFVEDQRVAMNDLDASNRRAKVALGNDHWNSRHDYARKNLIQGDAATSIDELIAARIQAASSSTEETATGPEAAFFYDKIEPILAEQCYRCHGEKEKGGLTLKDRARALEGGDSGLAAIVPGQPEESFLIELTGPDAGDDRMPPKGEGLSSEEIELLAQWVKDGAAMPGEKAKAIALAPLVDDATFLRRVYLDTVGVAPSLAEAQAFLNDSSPDKRDRIVSELLADPRWADNWVGYWQDVLAENPNLLKPKLNNTGPFRWWIQEAMADNKPLDRFATELILMRGSTWGGGTAGFAIASENDVPMAAKAHVISSAFLGVEMKCARCHDAPFHEWKQQDLFQMAAMLERKPIKVPDTSSVPVAFFDAKQRKPLIEVTLDPGAEVSPSWPFETIASEVPAELLGQPNDLREQLAAQVTGSRRFAEVVANRVWARLMGAGIVDPVHDWEGNAPSDPDLLASLADELIRSGYDLKAFTGMILRSEAYQREAIDLLVNVPSSDRYFEGPYRRRMSAEQIVDTAFHAAGQEMRTEQLTLDIEGTAPLTTFMNFGHPRRAWEFTTLANERDRPSLALPRVQAIADLLTAFGWRNARPEPTTEREEEPNLVQPGALANGMVGTWLTRLSDDSGLTEIAVEAESVEQLVDNLFLQLLTRHPDSAERQKFAALLEPGFAERLVPESEQVAPPEPQRFRYVTWSNHFAKDANIIKVQMEELARKGDPPTRYLRDAWRQRMEDAVWSLLNSPEMVMIP